ncbi:hypothetical protein [Thetidibacter halocola]|uniref:Uncharacterized protein n=1 Tax=Thetidibacter halocola TaxID=2827239 RepID=A0A8J7WIH7_9RHOB|nr:hypothetical protein [Thetidibacter halocola]MBS0126231.1 hypothetical protein [Thetidibacter halocola]
MGDKVGTVGADTIPGDMSTLDGTGLGETRISAVDTGMTVVIDIHRSSGKLIGNNKDFSEKTYFSPIAFDDFSACDMHLSVRGSRTCQDPDRIRNRLAPDRPAGM